MYYEAQLRLLRDVFRKCLIQTTVADLDALSDSQADTGTFFAPVNPGTLLKLLPEIQPATIYRLQNSFHCQYTCLLLPESATKAILIIGPYIASAPSDKQFMEWAEFNNISPRQQKQLREFYTALPILPQTSHLLVLLDAFCEQLWGVGGYNTEYLDWEAFVPLPQLTGPSQEDGEKDDTLWKMKNMEMRYSFENELIAAVSRGQIHKADMLLSNFSTMLFEQRVADPVRNAKNYCIIMNTLLRKAAEQGKVHPMYLDSVSSAYATRIEQLVSLEEILPLMTEMFRAYCRLVRKHSTQAHTPLVQQALIYIESNLNGDLSLRPLAQKLNISGSYLSTIFKKETGQTLTDLIAYRRVDRAKELLRTTRLQIQTVAQHCGIMDVHYFSKIFKKITGMTPKEYRESLKR